MWAGPKSVSLSSEEPPWTVGFGFHPNSMWSKVSFCGGRNVVQLTAEMSGLQRKVGNTVTTWREGRRIREGPHFSFTQLPVSRLQQGHWWTHSNSSALSPSKLAHPLYLFYSSWDLWAEHFSQGHRVNNKLGFRSNLTDATVYSLGYQTVWPMCYLLLIRTHGNSWLATVLSFGRKQKVGNRTEFSSLANCPRSNN